MRPDFFNLFDHAFGFLLARIPLALIQRDSLLSLRRFFQRVPKPRSILTFKPCNKVRTRFLYVFDVKEVAFAISARKLVRYKAEPPV